MELGLDYLEFTVPYHHKDAVLTGIPGGYELVKNDKGQPVGWRGYTRSAFIAQGKGRVGWSPDDERMGFHVSLGSQALSVMAGLDADWSDHPGLVGLVLDELGGHLTRVDVAFDDHEGILDLDAIGLALREGRFVSRWRSWQDLTSSKLVDGQWVMGQTFYMGSKKSDTQLRVYDKRAERLQKGKDVEPGPWVRAELQFRRKRANLVGQLFKTAKQNLEQVRAHLAGVLRGLVEFKAPNWDTNKQRQAASPWWVEFLEHAEKATLAVVVAEPRTVDDVKEWVSRQVAPSLALLEDALGFDRAWSFLFQEAQVGRGRYRPRHRAILAAS